MLWHQEEPIGIIVFAPPALSSSNRHRVFGGRLSPKILNRHFCNMARAVIDPRYRGAGLMADFLRLACSMQGHRYVEIIMSMGSVNHYWKRAGFKELGRTKMEGKATHRNYSSDVRKDTRAQSIVAVMRYYLLDTWVEFGTPEGGKA